MRRTNPFGRPRSALLRRLYRFGSGRWCPCCGRSSRRFMDTGAEGRHFRPDVRCPWCLSFERHRVMWLYLTEHSDLLGRRPRVLHFSPEPLLGDPLARSSSTYTTIDLLPGCDVRADITQRTGFDDGAFDLILCSHVLEHVTDDAAAMRELRRITAGECLVMVPLRDTPTTSEDPLLTTPEERRKAFGQADHLRYYGHDVVDRLAAAGFAVESFRPAERVPPERMEEMRLRPLDWLLVCRPG